MIIMQSKNLIFEPLTADHADSLLPILTTPSVLAFIDPDGKPQTLEELRAEYTIRRKGSRDPTAASERWFNIAIRLKTPPFKAIGRLEATQYNEWGEVAYLLGEAWWGKSLAFEAMYWWHDYLETVAPGTEWWATVHPANERSIRLLSRLQYEEAEAKRRPNIRSYDPGDRCFVRRL